MADRSPDIRARKSLMLGLVGIFLVQTWMVYTDPVGREAAPLSAEASMGQAVWHRHNCQSCHQIYGFGGFLGPDLTNAARHLTNERLDTVLTEGSEIMPAFHLDADDRGALASFFEELNLTGEGQARAATVVPARTLFEGLYRGSASADDPLDPLEEQGLTILLEKNCIDCHLPNAISAYRSADMTQLSLRLGRSGIAAIFASGVPGKAMPRFPFTEAEIDAVYAALVRLERHGDAFRDGFESAANAASGALFDLPWFEYRPVTGQEPDQVPETDQEADSADGLTEP
jgi:nitric oxide reductase subunit C